MNKFCSHCGAYLGQNSTADCEVKPDLTKPHQKATLMFETGPDKGRKTVMPVDCLTKLVEQ